MALRLKSLSEDTIDTYTHTWSAIFFLFLAFLTLVLQQPQTENSRLDEYSIICWCPAQFEQSHVAYTHAVCATRFKNEKKNGLLSGSSRFSPHLMPPHPPREDTKKKNNESEVEKIQDESPLSAKLNIPAFLFVLALGLRLPYIVWCILSQFANSVNMDQTLEAAKKGQYLNAESKRQLHANLMKVFNNRKTTSKNTATCLYMLMKILMIIVVIVEIVVVVDYLPQEANVKDTGSNNNSANSASPSNDNVLESQEHETPIYNCFFYIRQMQNVHDYRVQCLVKHNTDMIPFVQRMEETKEWAVSIVLPVFVLYTLSALTAAIILDTVVWFVVLSRHTSTRHEMGLDQDAPMDAVLLIEMAKSNLSHDVVSGLVNGQAGHSTTTDQGYGYGNLKLDQD